MNPDDPVDRWLDDLPPPAWAMICVGEDEGGVEPILIVDDDG